MPKASARDINGSRCGSGHCQRQFTSAHFSRCNCGSAAKIVHTVFGDNCRAVRSPRRRRDKTVVCGRECGFCVCGFNARTYFRRRRHTGHERVLPGPQTGWPAGRHCTDQRSLCREPKYVLLCWLNGDAILTVSAIDCVPPI